MRIFTRNPPRQHDAPAPVKAVAPDPADVELTDELVERVRVWLARDDAIVNLRETDPADWPTAWLLDDFLERIGL